MAALKHSQRVTGHITATEPLDTRLTRWASQHHKLMVPQGDKELQRDDSTQQGRLNEKKMWAIQGGGEGARLA
jgi:hypothetical protein